MDSRVRDSVIKKIHEAADNSEDAKLIAEALIGEVKNPRDFLFGIIVGRIYNSFHYQTRRILGRSETRQEFIEFRELLGSNTNEISRAIQRSFQDRQ